MYVACIYLDLKDINMKSYVVNERASANGIPFFFYLPIPLA